MTRQPPVRVSLSDQKGRKQSYHPASPAKRKITQPLRLQKKHQTIPNIMPKKLAKKSIKRGYGWNPDLPDHRDHVFATPLATATALPPKADLRKACPAVYDQGQLGSCTANAIAGAIEFDLLKQQLTDFLPSRLFIYYNERVMENTVASDAGAQIRDGIKSVGKQGVCPEPEWPYDISQFAVKPPPQAYTDALKNKALTYQAVTRNLVQMKGCLASGYPFVLGFTVYTAFESPQVASTGVLNMPASSESVLGGHAVLAVGYDDSAQRFTIRNSWGNGWGMKGYFTMPYAYLLTATLSSDFWTIRVVA
jgi:C1A family cysteine protease